MKRVVLMFTVVLVSCSYLEEPEPYVDRTVHATEIRADQQLHAQIGDTLTETLNVLYTPRGDSTNIVMVQLSFDTVVVASLSTLPFRFVVDARAFTNGMHRVRFLVFRAEQGVLNLLKVQTPAEIDTTSEFFLHQPAPPINAIFGRWNYPCPAVVWDYPSTAESDVIYYVINRCDSLCNMSITDTVYGHSHVYLDQAAMSDPCGVFSGYTSYSVGAANAVGISFAAAHSAYP